MNRYLSFTIVLLFCIIIIWSGGKHYSISVNFLFTAISGLAAFNLFMDEKRPFSLFKIFNLYSLFFIGIAPVVQFKENVQMWGVNDMHETEYIIGGITYLFAMAITSLIYNHVKRKKSNFILGHKYYDREPKKQSLSKSSLIKIVLCSFLLLAFTFYRNDLNIYKLLLRGVSEEMLGFSSGEGIQMSSQMWLICENYLRPMNSHITLLFYLQYGKQHKITFVILLLLSLLTLFPTAVPRFAAAAIYLPFLLVFCPFLQKGQRFSFIMVLGVLVVWPFLNIFRNFSFDKEVTFTLRLDEFATENFDSFSSLARVVCHGIITYGYQLLGVFLFWVPRSIWPSKPVGSGAFMAEELNFDFDNVSCNFFAEGYINFGILGLILFACILGCLISKIDNSYWNLYSTKKTNLFNGFYFLALGMLVFIMRGDALSSFAYTIGFMLSLLTAAIILNLQRNKTRIV